VGCLDACISQTGGLQRTAEGDGAQRSFASADADGSVCEPVRVGLAGGEQFTDTEPAARSEHAGDLILVGAVVVALLVTFGVGLRARRRGMRHVDIRKEQLADARDLRGQESPGPKPGALSAPD
jgi:hypothetical protein